MKETNLLSIKSDKKFIKQFEKRVVETIKKYNLISNKKEKILVACSGGKDSTTTLYLLKKLGFNIEAIHINLVIGKYSEGHLNSIKKLCGDFGVKLHVFDMREEYGSSICYIRSGIQQKVKLNNCAICGVIKKWLLNKKARELKASKIATGHNLDDEAESVLMNFFKGSPQLSATSGPKTGIISDKKFIQRIKPLYFLKNEEIRRYSKLMNFPIIYDQCVCLTSTLRKQTRKVLSDLEKTNPKIKNNLVHNLLTLLPSIIKSLNIDKGKQIKYCNVCGEPSRQDTCRRCKLMGILRE